MSSQTRSPMPMTSHGGDVRPVEISGWSTFAAMMLGIVGTLNVV
ncbi:MAG: hypothetical protein QOK49_4651 [Baekduia sp.]|nr:hypothetical protein [Baekduia sp.]